MGTYPSFAFSPKDDAVVIWAAGQIWHVPVSTNSRGERVAGSAPYPIRFRAKVEKRLAETRASDTDILKLETQDKHNITALTDLRVNHDGSKATFQAAGVTYVYDLKSEKAHQIPVIDEDAPYYSPSFVPNTDHLVIQARWSDTNFTTFELADTKSGKAYELTGLPLGRYYSPTVCECHGSHRRLAFIKTGGDYLSGDIIATAGAGLYIADFTLPSFLTESEHSISVKNVKFVSSEPALGSVPQTKIRFLEGAAKILVQQTSFASIIDLKAGSDEFGDYKQTAVGAGKTSTELAVAPSKSGADVAVVDFFHVYLAQGIKSDESVSSKPGNATKGLARLSLDGGHDVNFSGDGKKLFWLLGMKEQVL